jgi:O-antigen ligase
MIPFLRKTDYITFIKEGYIDFYISCLVVIVMPIYCWYLTPIMILWGALLIYRVIQKKYILDSDNLIRFLFFLYIAFFIWQVIGLSYSEHFKDGIRNITLRLPLFLFPLVLTNQNVVIRNKSKLILQIFSLSTFLFILFCVLYAIFRSVSFHSGTFIFNSHPKEFPWLSYFTASYFAIFQHPSYLSLYSLFSSFIAFEFFFNKKKSFLSPYLWLLISACLLTSVFLLSSRATILGAVISVPAYLLYRYKDYGIKKWVGIFTIFFILFSLIISNPRTNPLIKIGSKQDFINKTMKESRIDIWKSSIQIIKSNFLFGVGTGDIQYELNNTYSMNGEEELAKAQIINSHNQFLEISAENGVVGFILFVSIIILMGIIAFRYENPLYMFFLIITFISLFFETMLNRLPGLVFFSFFSFLIPLSKSEKLGSDI